MRTVLLYSAVLLSIAVCLGQDFFDPCRTYMHKKESQPRRSRGFDIRPYDPPNTLLCDHTLRRGWYRFVNTKGEPDEMPTTCQETDKCGTTTPIWMNGSHPMTDDGIVSHPLCGKRTSNGGCCEYTDTVFVKNCSSFYVYYLNSVLDCPSAYCAGSEERCPVGKWSRTGVLPCTDLTAPEIEPFVEGPIISDNKALVFECRYESDSDGPVAVFEVTWTFDGQSDSSIEKEIITGSNKVATLSGDELQRHTNTKIGCQVIGYYLGNEQNRSTFESNTTFFGVEAVSLTGPYLEGSNSFTFQCEVTPSKTDPYQNIEVVWTFDGKEDPNIMPQNISGQSRKAILPASALVGHLNSEVGCKARLVYDESNFVTAYRESNTYFTGIHINSGSLEISSREGEKDTSVVSTIPILCDQTSDCCLTFTLSINNPVVLLKNECGSRICSSDWDDNKKQASVPITIISTVNAVSSGLREAVLSFEELTVSGTGPFLNLFSGYKPKPTQIQVMPEHGAHCSMTSDPHFIGLDHHITYDLYQAGDFTVLQVKERNFEVQIRTWECFGVSCVCGVVVKDNNDIIRVHGCNLPHNDLIISTVVHTPYNLSAGTIVKLSANAQHIDIRFLSGSEINIYIFSTHMDVYIDIPASDWNRTRGICGTFDGIPENDFTHRDGTTSRVCSDQCVPVVFTGSWRVSGNDSMFNIAPEQTPLEPQKQFCSCFVNSQGKTESSCSPKQHIQENNLTCHNCPVITQDLKPFPWGHPGFEEKAYEHKALPQVDINRQWPNAKGVTEAQALEMCQNAIKKSQLYNKCQNMSNIAQTTMTQCMTDILIGGTTDMIDSATTLFTSNCQQILAQDERNYVIEGGKLVLNPDISTKVCPLECLTHGHCGNDGQCVCQNGWEGETCQTESGKGPQISRTGGLICQTRKESCDSVQFYKSNVNIFDKLICRVQAVDDTLNKFGAPVFLNAFYDPSPKVTCPLLKTERYFQKYTVAVSADNVTYSNELVVLTYNPTCFDCDESVCERKSTGCNVINNRPAQLRNLSL